MDAFPSVHFERNAKITVDIQTLFSSVQFSEALLDYFYFPSRLNNETLKTLRVCVQPQMIVDLAHVPNLTQRRADAPGLNPLSESPVTDDAVHVVQVPPPSNDDTTAANHQPTSPNHQPTSRDEDPVNEENVDEERRAQWNMTGGAGELQDDDSTTTTSDKADDLSTTKPSSVASHNLPKLIIPEHGVDQSASPRTRR